MRHPQALAQGPGGSGDFGRPLSGLGRHQAQQVGRFLREQELVPEVLIHSAALRCSEAAQQVAGMAGVRSAQVFSDQGLYLCSPADIEQRLAERSESRVMILGHNPTMAECMISAVGRDSYDDGHPVHVPPGFLGQLRFTALPPTFAPGVCEVLATRLLRLKSPLAHNCHAVGLKSAGANPSLSDLQSSL